jgi:hypothetical protein
MARSYVLSAPANWNDCAPLGKNLFNAARGRAGNFLSTTPRGSLPTAAACDRLNVMADLPRASIAIRSGSRWLFRRSRLEGSSRADRALGRPMNPTAQRRIARSDNGMLLQTAPLQRVTCSDGQQAGAPAAAALGIDVAPYRR